MSRSKSKRSAPKYQRAKLAVLPFLFAVLGYVLLADSDSEDAKPAATRVTARDASGSRQHSHTPAGGEQRGAQQAKLPDWSQLASEPGSTPRSRCNPFLPIVKEEEEKRGLPEIPASLQPPQDPLPQAEVAAAGEPPAEAAAEPVAPAVDVATLMQQPVRYFFKTERRRVMLVGDQLLSEGQKLDSYTVTRLEPNRIQLEPASGKP